MLHKWRSLLVLPLVVAGFSIVGGLYGPKMQVAEAANEGEDRQLSTFTGFYSLVEQNFADPVNPDKAIYKGAIPGMLRTLDPHSNFFDPKEYQALREDQRGHYFGVGMQIGSRNGKTVISFPFPGSPAYKAGLRPGDVIVKVNDKSTDGLTTSEVAELLKGPRGTQITVAVSREGAPDPIPIVVTRDEITRKSVPDAFWLKPGIAYVKITNFVETTTKDLDDNLRRLGESSIRGLVLDLRDNPGGLLNEGVGVADRFLQRNQLIVSHRGRASAERPYYARTGNRGRDYPIVVLVSRLSASAAEIVSGALQDHDRAYILGEKTFGKGLVQTVYPLSNNTGLALTTAHFYTPSGRLIQRDYSNRSFYDYYYHRDENAQNPNDVKMTDSGRTVYGGGGITPDEKFEPPTLDRFQAELVRSGFFDFVRHYFATHPASLPEGWMPDNQTIRDFHDFLVKKGTAFTEQEFNSRRDWIVRNLAREVYMTAFNADVADRMYAQTDPIVLKAVDSMPKALALVENARKIIVQRMNSRPPSANSSSASAPPAGPLQK